MSKIKVLQFTIANSMGGQTRYNLNLWKHIDRTKIHFDFVTFSRSLDFLKGIDLGEGKVFQMSVYPEADREEFVREFNKILDEGYDIIEIHTSYWKDTIVEEIARRRGIRIIIHSHSTGVVANLSYIDMQKAIARHMEVKQRINDKIADAFWACSKEAAEWLYGGRISESKIEIIKNTIETKRFAFQASVRKAIRKELGLEDCFVVGHVGRLENVKNQEFIFKIIKNIGNRLPIKCLMVGEGSLRDNLQRIAYDLEINENVIFLGRREDTEKLYQAMDVFLLPSFFEGFPIALLEAQCAGLKCICSTNISEDAVLTENTHRIPLEQQVAWELEIMNMDKGYYRKSYESILVDRGYDSRTEIGKLERRYAEIQGQI